jgi:hypothetical protein
MPSMTAQTRPVRRGLDLRVAALALLLGAVPGALGAQDFEFEDEPAKRSVGFQFGAQRALGDLLVFTERGLGLNLHARQPVKGSRLLSLRADVGFSRFAQGQQRGGTTAGSTSFDNQFTAFSAMLGAQVTADNETFRPYLHAGAGVGLASASLTPTGPNLSKESTSGVGLAWMGGAGVYRLLGESDREWALDVGVRVLGMPSIDLPAVRVSGSQFAVDRRSASTPAWSFVLGLHFVP